MAKTFTTAIMLLVLALLTVLYTPPTARALSSPESGVATHVHPSATLEGSTTHSGTSGDGDVEGGEAPPEEDTDGEDVGEEEEEMETDDVDTSSLEWWLELELDENGIPSNRSCTTCPCRYASFLNPPPPHGLPPNTPRIHLTAITGSLQRGYVLPLQNCFGCDYFRGITPTDSFLSGQCTVVYRGGCMQVSEVLQQTQQSLLRKMQAG